MFVGSSDLFWMASAWISLLTFALIALVVVMLLLLKRMRMRSLKEDRMFDERWRSILVAVALDQPQQQPLPIVVSPADRWRLLKLWIRMQMLLQGAARERLQVLGHTLNLQAIAMPYFQSKRRPEQVLGVMCLGFLKDKRSWSSLESLLHDPSRTLSLHAAWALLELDGERAADLALDVLLQRPISDMAQTCALFKPFSQLLLKAWHQRLGQPSDTVQLLKLAIALEMAVPDEWLLALLENGATTEAIIGVLKLLRNPTSLPVIERLSQHEQWQVRTQVASALGRIGTLAQWSILEKLITDPQWWVRYRAAQAMTCCDAVSHDQLQLQATQWTDRFAKDMLNQVLAQRRNHYVD